MCPIDGAGVCRAARNGSPIPPEGGIAPKEEEMPARRKPARKPARRKAAPKRKVAAKKKAAPKKAAAAPPPAPSAIGAMNHHLDYTTHDIEGVKRFYTHLLGFSQFNEDPKFNYLWI